MKDNMTIFGMFAVFFLFLGAALWLWAKIK
jgi:hypothetical protein